MRHISKCLFILLLVTLVMNTSVWAQGTATIAGSVKDATGAVLPGVDITATQTATGAVRMAITDETGSYNMQSLPIGPYRLEAGLPGFRTYVQTGINLEVNASPTINIVLEVGQVSEQVEVQANAALVETRTVGVGQIMEQERILELPLNGRNVTELITLGGAAVQTGTSDSRSMPGQQAIRVAGGQAGSVAYSLDGATHNNPYDNLSLPLPFPDALQEFKVETSALSASQGQHSGAQVNAVTRSGTNEFHGALFEFVRNDLFNARQYFAVTQSTLKRNQFGGTFGGAIVKNKLFFFGGYQGTTIREDPADIKRWVPTAAALAGDFSGMTSAECNSGTARNLTGFPGNQIDPALFSPAAVKLAKMLPTPLDKCGLVIYGNQRKDNDGQEIGKVDWQVTPNHAFVGRVLFTGNTRAVPHALRPDNLLNSGGTSLGFDNLAQSYTIGDTWLKSPETVVSGRLSVHYTNVQRLGADIVNPTELGVKNHFSYLPNYTLITMSDPGFPIGGGTQSFSTFRTFTTGLNTDVTMSRGSHQAAYGGTLIYVDSNSNANVLSPGSFGFTGKNTTFPLADFLLGKAATYAQSAPNTNYVRMWYMAAYFADTWKVSQRLTLNYGMRWEPDNGEVLTLGRIQNYSEERRIARIRSKVFTKAPYGFYYVGDEGFPGKRGRNLNWFTFAPRFGFAMDVNGDGKMSIRGSGGIAYEKPNAQFHLWTSIAPPWGANVNLTDVQFDDPWANFPGGNPFPVSFGTDSPFVANGEITAVPWDLIKPSQVQNWNLSIQRQLGSDFLISASYLGSHTIHMIDTVPLNPAIYIPGQCVAGQYGLTAPGPCSTTTNTNFRRRLSLTDPETGALVSNLANPKRGNIQLQRPAVGFPEARDQRRHAEWKLHLVPLHWFRTGPQWRNRCCTQ